MQLSSSPKRSRLVSDRRYARLLCARPMRFEQQILQIIVYCWFCQLEIVLYLCCFVLGDVIPPSPQVQSAFMRMDVNGDGTLTKREMLAAEEFTPEEVNN